MKRSDLKWWAGLIGVCAASLLGLDILPHLYHDWMLGVAGVCGAICTYMMSSNAAPS